MKGSSKNDGTTSIEHDGLLLRGRRNGLALAAALIVGLGGLPPALAQNDPHVAVRDSLVHIQIKGETENGLPLGSEGTGFLVTNDGYILTVQHLLDPLSESDPEKIEIWVSIKEKKTSPDKRAFIVNPLPFLDLLLLKIPTSIEEYTAVTLGSTADLRAGSGQVYTSGFATTLDNIIPQEVDIVGRDGPGGYTWVLDSTNIDYGQSGSPVYDQNGRVIGILKGILHGADRQQIIGSLFIPIEHADALLLPARFDELRKLARTPARCRVCFKQALLANCFGAQQSCSDWSAVKSDTAASAPASADDEGWSDGITFRAGGDPASESDSCEVKWKIECE